MSGLLLSTVSQKELPGMSCSISLGETEPVKLPRTGNRKRKRIILDGSGLPCRRGQAVTLLEFANATPGKAHEFAGMMEDGDGRHCAIEVRLIGFGAGKHSRSGRNVVTPRDQHVPIGQQRRRVFPASI